MSEHRIYNKITKIDSKQVQEFYDKRAELFDQKGLTSVLLGDQDPNLANYENEYDRNVTTAKLLKWQGMRVLDLGCGVGRWAEMLLPECEFYFGVDFSSEMVKIARKNCEKIAGSDGRFQIEQMSVEDVVEKPIEFFGGKFDLILVCGVFMYVNDKALNKLISGLANLLNPHAVLYFTDTVAVEQRLTLDNFVSEALNSSYSVIYRTKDEYLSAYSPLLQDGFAIDEDMFRPRFNQDTTYSETGRWQIILVR